jgi:hypothetical protein
MIGHSYYGIELLARAGHQDLERTLLGAVLVREARRERQRRVRIERFVFRYARYVLVAHVQVGFGLATSPRV